MSAPRGPVLLLLASGLTLTGRLARRGLFHLVLFLEGDGARVVVRRSAVVAIATPPAPPAQTNERN